MFGAAACKMTNELLPHLCSEPFNKVSEVWTDDWWVVTTRAALSFLATQSCTNEDTLLIHASQLMLGTMTNATT